LFRGGRLALAFWARTAAAHCYMLMQSEKRWAKAHPTFTLCALREGAHDGDMQALITSVLAVSIGASSVHAGEPMPELLARKLLSLSGASARDCGFAALPDNIEAVVACAKAAASSGQPYRVAFHLAGADALIWQGAARGERGDLWVVFYDAESADGTAVQPTLSVLTCREITFATKGDVVDCQPVTGER